MEHTRELDRDGERRSHFSWTFGKSVGSSGDREIELGVIELEMGKVCIALHDLQLMHLMSRNTSKFLAAMPVYFSGSPTASCGA